MRLHIENINKSFGGAPVLAGVNLSVEKVHSLVLIGPSGGGKSTLLKVLGGLIRPETGNIEIDGRPLVYGKRALQAHRRSVGTVFQAFNLFPHLSAFENIALPLEKVHGLNRSEASAVTRRVLDRFRLLEHGPKRPAALSGGQRQRVAIARAVAIKPRLLLFDEPTSSLDPEMTSEVLDLILELRGEGLDFILATHEMGFARVIADHAAFLSCGRIVEARRGRDLFDAPEDDSSRKFLSKILKY